MKITLPSIGVPALRATAAEPSLRLLEPAFKRRALYLDVFREGDSSELTAARAERHVFSYFPGLASAKAFAAIDGLKPAVQAHLKGIDLPAHVRPIFERTVGVGPSEKISPLEAQWETVFRPLTARPELTRAYTSLSDTERLGEFNLGANRYLVEFHTHEEGGYFNPNRQTRAESVKFTWGVGNPSFFDGPPEASSAILNYGLISVKVAGLVEAGLDATSFDQVPAELRSLTLRKLDGTLHSFTLLGDDMVRDTSGQQVAISSIDGELQPLVNKFQARIRKHLDENVGRFNAQPLLVDRRGAAPRAPVDATAFVSVFRAGSGAADTAKIDALQAMQSMAPEAPTFGDIMQAQSALLASGAETERLDFSSLSPENKAAVLQAVTADRHEAAAVLLWSQFVDGIHEYRGGAELDQAIANQKGGNRQWRYKLQGFHADSTPQQRAFALRGLTGSHDGFETFSLRTKLMRANALSTAELVKLFVRDVDGSKPGALSVLLEWASSHGDEQIEKVRTFLSSFLYRDPRVTRSASAADRAKAPEAEAAWASELKTWAEQLTQADLLTRPGVVSQIAAVLKTRDTYTMTRQLGQLLGRLHQHDLTTALPLSARDELVSAHSISTHELSVAPTVSIQAATAQHPRLAHDLHLLGARLLLAEGGAVDLEAARAQALRLMEKAIGSADETAAARRTLLTDFERWITSFSTNGAA